LSIGADLTTIYLDAAPTRAAFVSIFSHGGTKLTENTEKDKKMTIPNITR
jgi:hypothetical protein